MVLSHWLALLQPHGITPCVSTSKFPSSCKDSSPIGFRAHEQSKGPFSFPFRPVSQQWLTRKLAGCPGHAVCGLLPPWLQRRARKGVSGGTPRHGTVGMETVLSAQPRTEGRRRNPTSSLRASFKTATLCIWSEAQCHSYKGIGLFQTHFVYVFSFAFPARQCVQIQPTSQNGWSALAPCMCLCLSEHTTHCGARPPLPAGFWSPGGPAGSHVLLSAQLGFISESAPAASKFRSKNCRGILQKPSLNSYIVQGPKLKQTPGAMTFPLWKQSMFMKSFKSQKFQK